jgi:hypothetical protein
VFGSVKKALKDHRFRSDKVKVAVVHWFQQQVREFFADWIHRLVRQWDACLNAHGDYF